MTRLPPDFQVNIQGRTFLTVKDGQLDVSGTDLQTDLANVARLIGILSDVVGSALIAGRSPALEPPVQRDNVYPIAHARRPSGQDRIGDFKQA